MTCSIGASKPVRSLSQTMRNSKGLFGSLKASLMTISSSLVRLYFSFHSLSLLPMVMTTSDRSGPINLSSISLGNL